MIEPGEITNKYLVEALIGEGGIARVYRVRHTTLGSAHALKLLAVRGGAIHRRLVREGRIQATLDHPHVVSVTDVIEHNGHPGLVMEYIEGHSLDRVLASTGSLSIPVTLSLSAQILGAIAAAHARSVLHRDLKPANVMLEPTTGGVRAMVTDFGIARLMADTSGDTLQGDFLGTPGYMAPEQVSDPTAVDVRADIYSLGALVYCMVCGRPPFLPSASLVDTLRAASAADFPTVLSLRPDCPPHVASAIEAALAADPAGRPDTVEAFARRLFVAAPELMQVVGGQAGVADLELPGFRTSTASDALAPITGTPLTGRPNQTVVPDTYDAGPNTIASMLDDGADASAPNLAALLVDAAAATAAAEPVAPVSEDAPPPSSSSATREGTPSSGHSDALETETPGTPTTEPQPVAGADHARSPNTLDAVQAVRGPARWPWAVAGLVVLGLGALVLQPDSSPPPATVPVQADASAPTAPTASAPSTASTSTPVPPVAPAPAEVAPEPVPSKQTDPDALPPTPTADPGPTAPSPSPSSPPPPDPPPVEPAPTGSDTPPEEASPPPPTEAPEPPQTGSDAPPDDGASSSEVPAAAAESPDEAPPPAPETTPPSPAVPLVQGTWTGKSKGRALKLRIVSQSGGRIVGELELAAGPQNYKFFSVAGRIEPDGSFALSESAPGWRLEGRVINNEVVGTMRHPDSRKPSSFSAARQ